MQDGQQYGDEYLAELDYIEVVERLKEGYESDVDINVDESGSDKDEEDPESDFGGSDSDRLVYHTTSSQTEKMKIIKYITLIIVIIIIIVVIIIIIIIIVIIIMIF